MNAAIYYHPERYTTGGPKLMGRNAAGESFLRGFLRHSQASEFWVQVEHVEHVRLFIETARAEGRNEPIRGVDPTRLAALSRAGVVYVSGRDKLSQKWS